MGDLFFPLPLLLRGVGPVEVRIRRRRRRRRRRCRILFRLTTTTAGGRRMGQTIGAFPPVVVAGISIPPGIRRQGGLGNLHCFLYVLAALEVWRFFVVVVVVVVVVARRPPPNLPAGVPRRGSPIVNNSSPRRDDDDSPFSRADLLGLPSRGEPLLGEPPYYAALAPEQVGGAAAPAAEVAAEEVHVVLRARLAEGST